MSNQKTITELNKTVAQLNSQNKELLTIIEKIENSYSHKISTFIREKFLDRIVPRQKREELLRKRSK